jgi:soluble lytic murein transglycosylase
MKFIRFVIGLWLATAVGACSLVPSLPTIPPGWTLTPSIPPATAEPPVPSSTPTPIPVARIETGDRAYFNGDFDTALIHYQSAYQDSPDPVLRAAAKWGEARVQYAEGRLPESLTALQTLITEYPASVHFTQAYFLQGLANYRLERYNEAAASWQTYVVLKPGMLDAYTQELRGDALFSAGAYADALAAYTAAIQAPRLDDAILVDLKVAASRAELGDTDGALALYDGILARATNDYIKAQAAYEAGRVYQDLARLDEAFRMYRLAVENYPLSNYSYLCLIQLVDAGAEVSDLDRGLVDYFAGQYDVALAALDRYLADNPGNDGTPHYYRALTLRELGDHEASLEAFTTFILNYPSNPHWAEAWGEKAYTQWALLGNYTQGAQTLIEYVGAVPGSSLAVDYLMTAARVYERDNQLEQAAATWARIANEYPGDELASTAIFLAGIIYYRLGDFNSALSAYNRSLALAVLPEDQARAYLWIGKAQQGLGDGSAALASWQQGVTIDPGGYYSERARDLLIGRAPFAPPASTNLSPDLAAERADADAWVRLTFDLPPDTDLSGAGSLEGDPRFLRGREFWGLGLYEESRLEFESLRAAINTNPVDTYRLANTLLDLGLYRPAIFAARQTLTLAGLDNQDESMMAPPYFSHVRYGLYYRDLVVDNAQSQGFDPLFLFSVIRQESLFEGFVHSTAGARGLMQIVPSTGANIASEIGWPLEFVADDLYRPYVSLRLGTDYLASNRDRLDGNLYAALAAYNAGPGNAVLWKGLAGDDPDLLLEVIRFQETRDYIRNIYEIYTIYRRLYGTGTQ